MSQPLHFPLLRLYSEETLCFLKYDLFILLLFIIYYALLIQSKISTGGQLCLKKEQYVTMRVILCITRFIIKVIYHCIFTHREVDGDNESCVNLVDWIR